MSKTCHRPWSPAGVSLPGADHSRVDVDVVEHRQAGVALAQVVDAAEVQPEVALIKQELLPFGVGQRVVALDGHQVAQARVPVIGDDHVLGQHEVTQHERPVARTRPSAPRLSCATAARKPGRGPS